MIVLEPDGFIRARTKNGVRHHIEERIVKGHTYRFEGTLSTLWDFLELEDWHDRIDKIASGEIPEGKED